MPAPIFIPTPIFSGGEWNLGIFGICVISLVTIFILSVLINIGIDSLKWGEKFIAYIFFGFAFIFLLMWVGAVFGLK